MEKPTYEVLEKRISELEAKIDDYRKLEKVLLEKEEMCQANYRNDELDLYFNSSLDLLCIADTDGYFRRLNPQWEKTLGYTLTELIDKKFLDYVHPNDLEDTYKAIATLSDQNEVCNFINRYRCKDETYRWLEWRSFPYQKSIYAVARDITDKKQIEQDLIAAKERAQESEAIIKAAMENSHAGIAIAELPSGKLKYVNKAGLMIRNKAYDEIVKDIGIDKYVSSWHILHLDGTPYEADEVPLARAVLYGETCSKEFIVRRDDNEYRYVLANAAPIFNDKGVQTGAIVVFLDITDKKQVEFDLLSKNEEYESLNEELRQTNDELLSAKVNVELNEQKLKEAQELAKIGSWELDIANNKVYWSDEIYRIFGCKPQAFGATYEAFLKFIHPDDREFVEQAYQNHIKNKQPYNIIHRIVTQNSETKYVNERCKSEFDENGNPLYSVGAIADITEQILVENELKNAKERAEENEKKFRAIFENSQDAVGISKRGITVFANAAYLKLFGIEDLSGIEGKPILNQIAPHEHQKIKEYVQKRALGEYVPLYYETIGLRTNGEEFPFEIKIGTYTLNNDNYTIAIIRDLTDRKFAEQKLIQSNLELKAAKERAEESDHLKTAFLQNMSHEIRTPMNAIVGFTEMLNKPDLSEVKRKSYISIVTNSTMQLLSIVTDILTISSLETKQEKLNIKNICVNNIIVELLAVFRPQASNQNISLYAKQELPDSQTEIFTDDTKLTQILTNLITNALKFTHKGFIEFGYSIVAPRHSMATQTGKDKHLQFYVKDTGIGISPEMQHVIFERFRQADLSITKKYGGTGLGLSISKGFIELLGGDIWVESEPDKGSTFYFTIPYKPVHVVENEVILTQQNYGKRILVAEDDEYNYLYMEELLLEMGLTPLHAKNGKETIALCTANKNIALILMDIKMPFMDGHTAALAIKKFRPDLPIVAQSAYALEHEIERYGGIAFDDYLTKPIDKNEFKRKVLKYTTINK